MLHPLPDAVPDRAASLYEPVSIACHGLMRAMPADGDPVLVVGAGIIGLAALAALRGLFPRLPRHRARPPPPPGRGGHGMRRGPRRARRRRQRALGGAGRAERVARGRAQAPPDAHGRLPLRRRGGRVTPVGDRGPARRRPPGHRAPARRGGDQRGRPHARSGTRRPPSSAPSTTPSTRASAPGLAGGPDRHSVDRALDVLSAGFLPDAVVVTHEFGLEDYREAVETAIDRTPRTPSRSSSGRRTRNP